MSDLPTSIFEGEPSLETFIDLENLTRNFLTVLDKHFPEGGGDTKLDIFRIIKGIEDICDYYLEENDTTVDIEQVGNNLRKFFSSYHTIGELNDVDTEELTDRVIQLLLAEKSSMTDENEEDPVSFDDKLSDLLDEYFPNYERQSVEPNADEDTIFEFINAVVDATNMSWLYKDLIENVDALTTDQIVALKHTTKVIVSSIIKFQTNSENKASTKPLDRPTDPEARAAALKAMAEAKKIAVALRKQEKDSYNNGIMQIVANRLKEAKISFLDTESFLFNVVRKLEYAFLVTDAITRGTGDIDKEESYEQVGYETSGTDEEYLEDYTYSAARKISELVSKNITTEVEAIQRRFVYYSFRISSLENIMRLNIINNLNRTQILD